MEAYVRLPGGSASEFYLAQVDAIHAGKTLVIDLWDPGDTGSLPAHADDPPANHQRLHAGDHQLAVGPVAPPIRRVRCGGQTGTNVTSIVTNTARPPSSTAAG